MYKHCWDRPSFLDHESASDRSSAFSSNNNAGRPPVLAEFEVDYIISFVAGEGQGAPTLSEALSKLHQMDDSGNILTIRCQLLVTGRDLIVINRQSGVLMETFPLKLMREVLSNESRDPKETFNNIFVFFVVIDESEPPEMHIFQSVMTPATRIADEVNRIKEGRYQAVAASAAARNGRNSLAVPGAPALPESSRRSVAGSEPSRAESPTVTQAEKQVSVLNRCFDDIEQFVRRIQIAVESTQKLQSRQNQRKKKDKQVGDGMLIACTRMPAFEDFIDCFKKFKLAFNLLARLQDFIHEPNASELVHYLFTPLVFITKASPPPSELAVPEDRLISHVVSPLLTREAVVLLRHCLTSKEFEFWRSLGDGWTAAKETWKGYVPPFTPRFSDNYTPPLEHFQDALGYSSETDGPSNGTNPRSPVPTGATNVFPEPTSPSPKRHDKEPAIFPLRSQAPSLPSPPIETSTSELTWVKRQQLFRGDILSRNGRVMQAIAAKRGENRKELTVIKGEFLEVLEAERNWWKMKNMAGEVGHVPYTFLKECVDFKENDTGHRTSSIPRPPPPPPPPAPPTIDPYSSGIAVRRKGDFRYQS